MDYCHMSTAVLTQLAAYEISALAQLDDPNAIDQAKRDEYRFNHWGNLNRIDKTLRDRELKRER